MPHYQDGTEDGEILGTDGYEALGLQFPVQAQASEVVHFPGFLSTAEIDEIRDELSEAHKNGSVGVVERNKVFFTHILVFTLKIILKIATVRTTS